MGSGQMTGQGLSPTARADAGGHPCPQYRRDYVRIAAWLSALLFGPALVALVIWLT